MNENVLKIILKEILNEIPLQKRSKMIRNILAQSGRDKFDGEYQEKLDEDKAIEFIADSY